MIRLHPYHIPFKKPFTISNQRFSQRSGILINWGLGWGDAAPLHGFSVDDSMESIMETMAWLQHSDNWPDPNEPFSEAFEQWIETIDSASLRFAVHSAAIQHAARSQGVTLAHYLKGDSASSKVKTNATLGISDMNQTLSQAKLLIDAGFRTLKIKVGNDPDFETEILHYLRTAFPELGLRVDANQAWSLDQAIEVLNRWEAFGIEYCEQPVACSDLNGLKAVKKQVATPIAADESVSSVTDAFSVMNEQAADVLILKPQVLGSWSECGLISELATHRDMTVIFTTLLESGIGRAFTAHLAATFGASAKAHGLATGLLMNDSVYDDTSHIKQGYYHLPDTFSPQL